MKYRRRVVSRIEKRSRKKERLGRGLKSRLSKQTQEKGERRIPRTGVCEKGETVIWDKRESILEKGSGSSDPKKG